MKTRAYLSFSSCSDSTRCLCSSIDGDCGWFGFNRMTVTTAHETSNVPEHQEPRRFNLKTWSVFAAGCSLTSYNPGTGCNVGNKSHIHLEVLPYNSICPVRVGVVWQCCKIRGPSVRGAWIRFRHRNALSRVASRTRRAKRCQEDFWQCRRSPENTVRPRFKRKIRQPEFLS